MAPFPESADEVDSGVGILDDEDNEDDEDLELAAFPDGITRLAAPEGAALEVGSQALELVSGQGHLLQLDCSRLVPGHCRDAPQH